VSETVEPLSPPARFYDAIEALQLDLPATVAPACGEYLARLLEANRRFNLTAVREADEAWMRHVLDALSLVPFVGEVKSLVDVGSGGGLPGLVLAIALPGVKVTLIEATGKKARFLESTAQAMGLGNVAVVAERAETVGRDAAHREKYDAATGRAIGPLRVMLELTLPLVRVGGWVIAPKGAQAEAELREAGDALMLLGAGEVEVYDALPGVVDDAVAVMVQKAQPTPSEYPRRPGVPKHEPL